MRPRVALLVSVAAVVALVGWLWWRSSPADLMAEFVAELRARGEPVTIADMERPMPPVEENGADDLAKVLLWLERRLAREDRDLEASDRDFAWWSYYAGPWHLDMEKPWHEHATAEQLDETQQFLRTLGPLYEGIAAATGKREIACPLPEDAVTSSIFGPNGYAWRDAFRLISARAIAATAESDRLDAMEWLVALVRRARPRTVVDHLHASEYRRKSCAVLRDGVEAGHLDAVEVRSSVDPVQAFPMLCDGSLHRELRQNLRSIDAAFNERPPPNPRERLDNAVGDALTGVRFDAPACIASLREFDAVIPPEGAWNDEAEAALADFERRSGDGWTTRIVDSLRSADAADAIARVALAVCEHRAVHGDWPRTSDDLRPLFHDGVPADPYTGAPFEMRRDGHALVLRASPPDDAAWVGDVELRDVALEWRLVPR